MSSIINTPNETGQQQQQQQQQQYNDSDQPSRDVESASITSSDISPIMDILLHETLLDRNDNDSVDANKLSRRVWEDVKRRLHLLNVYLGIDTDEDENYSYLWDDENGGVDDDQSDSYARSDRTATTVVSSSTSSMGDHLRDDTNNQREGKEEKAVAAVMIRRIQSS
jgi:hypothetical protein